jgi:hypothetical protein
MKVCGDAACWFGGDVMSDQGELWNVQFDAICVKGENNTCFYNMRIYDPFILISWDCFPRPTQIR